MKLGGSKAMFRWEKSGKPQWVGFWQEREETGPDGSEERDFAHLAARGSAVLRGKTVITREEGNVWVTKALADSNLPRA